MNIAEKIRMSTGVAMILFAFVNLTPAQSSFAEANYVLHTMHKTLLKYPEFKKCEAQHWPNTEVCNAYARVSARMIETMDEKFGGE